MNIDKKINCLRNKKIETYIFRLVTNRDTIRVGCPWTIPYLQVSRMIMRAARIQAIALAVLLLAVCLGYRLATKNTYVASYPLHEAGLIPEDIRLHAETPGIVRHDAPRIERGYVRIPIRPEGPGDTFVDIRDSDGRNLGILRFQVGHFGTVYDGVTGGFTGDSMVLSAITVFCFGLSVILFRAWRGLRGPAFYAYSAIHAVGFSLFALLTGVTMLIVTLRHLLRPDNFSMFSAYRALCSASWRFMMLTALPLAVFAAAMIVSNIALVRHEGFSFKNVLGIGVALGLAAGEVLAFILYTRVFFRLRVGNAGVGHDVQCVHLRLFLL